MAQLLKRLLWFSFRCLGQAVLSSLCFALLFAIFGLIIWCFSGERDVLLISTLFGAFLGVLWGIGQVIIDTFGEKPDQEPKADWGTAGSEVAQEVAGRVVPPLGYVFLVFRLFAWATTTDFKAQKPGRWQRAVLGAVVLGLVAFFLVVVAASVIPERPGALTFWQALWAVPVAAAFGAALGAVSDSF